MGHARTPNAALSTGAPPSPAAVLRSRAAQFASLVGRILNAGNTIEASQVHKLRVLARRLRVALKVLTPPGQEPLARLLHKQSGKLRSEAGGIRDCDVHLELLHALDAAPRTKRPAGIADAQLLISSDREHLVISLQQRLDQFKPQRFLKLAEQLASHIEDHHQSHPDDAASTAAMRAKLVFDQLRTIAASSPSTPDAFHRLRLAVKAFRYARESLATAGSVKTTHAAALADIQTRLGDLNDVATLADRLDRYASHIDTQHASELLPATKQLRDSLRSLGNGFSAVFQSRAAQFGEWWQTMYGQGAAIAQLAPDIPLQTTSSQRDFSMISPDASAGSSGQAPSKETRHDDVPPPPLRSTAAGLRPQPAHADLWLAGKVVAVIDIGSNSIRLLIVELIDQFSWKVLHQDRSMTRLAHGLVDNNRLSDEAVARSIDAIARFSQAARDRRCVVLAAFATAAVRDATNGRDFMTQVRSRCGVDVRLVTSDEEGKLTFESVARVFDLSSEPVAVADLGGGSLEVLHSR
ncbi:MAG: CHAD domain-containing protein, partial [Planctomycetota bacterium]|nr:CHAD domain-containing protein [Planctomycetota bacterium]